MTQASKQGVRIGFYSASPIKTTSYICTPREANDLESCDRRPNKAELSVLSWPIDIVGVGLILTIRWRFFKIDEFLKMMTILKMTAMIVR